MSFDAFFPPVFFVLWISLVHRLDSTYVGAPCRPLRIAAQGCRGSAGCRRLGSHGTFLLETTMLSIDLLAGEKVKA